jgi:hypothetical protein
MYLLFAKKTLLLTSFIIYILFVRKHINIEISSYSFEYIPIDYNVILRWPVRIHVFYELVCY